MDECKALLERIATALESIQEAQVYILANLDQINKTVGGV